MLLFRLPTPHACDSHRRRLTVAAAAHARLAESYAPCTRSLPSQHAPTHYPLSTRHERAPETRHDTTVAAGRYTPTHPLPQSSCSRHVRVPRQVPPGPRARHRTLPTDNLTYMRVLAQNVDPLEPGTRLSSIDALNRWSTPEPHVDAQVTRKKVGATPPPGAQSRYAKRM